MRRALTGLAITVALASAACAPRSDEGRADSSPAQPGAPVVPPPGATAAAAPAPVVPETAGVVVPRAPADTARARKDTGDTRERDQAIPYKRDPRKELPPAKP